MLILDLTMSVKPKKVLEWKYFILSFTFSLQKAKWQLCVNVQIMCGVKLNLKKIDTIYTTSCPMSQLFQCLVMPKCLNNNDNGKKNNKFLRFFSTMKAFPLRSATVCEAAISRSNPSNLVTVFLLFVQQKKPRTLNKRDICMYSNALNIFSGE